MTLEDCVYLDNNATTRVDDAVVAAMLPYFTEHFGNASSMHSFGGGVGKAVKAARESVAQLLGAEFDHEVVFTSGGTESNNMAILSSLEVAGEGRNEVVTSAVEHPAILSVLAHLEKTRGVVVHRIGVDSRGRLDLDAYARALSRRTALASIMWANNETGTIFPVQLLAGLAHEVGALFHTDAVQAVGKVPVQLAGTAIDLLSLSGHKLHGPKGIGALYVKRGVRFRPLLRGGHQERGRRAGTENVPGVIGLGKAAELAADALLAEMPRIAALRDQLERTLLASVPSCFVCGDVDRRVPNTSTIAFELIEGEAILLRLDRARIAASSGSACTSGSLEPSHVLRAMNVPFTAAHGAIRFSLSRRTTPEDVERTIAAVPAIIGELRQLSPFWDAGKRSAFDPTYSAA